MASEWRRTSVGEVCSSIVDCVNKTAPVVNHETPYRMIRTTNIKNGRLDMSNTKYVHEGTFRHWTRRAVPQTGDVLLTREAPLGEVAIIRDEQNVFLGQRLMQYRADRTKLDPRFLFYSFLGAGLQSQIRAHGGSGSTVDHIRVPDCMRFELSLPPLPEQRAIAHILGVLDDKIELNRRMSETLEAMARALFKSWFVDFDPVRAKSESRDPGLPKDLADLFPDSFEESELGKIPYEWRTGTLGEIADHPRRGMQPGEIEPQTPYIGLEHMPMRRIALADWGYGDGLESNKFEFKRGEILFGKLRPYFHKSGVAPLDGVCSTDIVVIKPKSAIWFGFVLGHASSVEFVTYANAGSTGTKMPRTNWSDMASYAVVLPPSAVACAFNEKVQPAVDRIIEAIHESRTLAAIRDTLLPKLISGELRVKDAKRFLERTAA